MMKTNKITLFFFLFLSAMVFGGQTQAREICKDGQYEYVDRDTGEITCQEDQVGEEGKDHGCTDLNTRLNEAEECLFCPLFEVLFKAAHTMAVEATKATAIPVRNVMVVGFAVWLAFTALGYVSSFTKADLAKHMTGVFTMAFKVLIAFLLLSNVEELYTLFINPLLMAGLDFGGAMLFGAGQSTMAECKAAANGTLEGILPEGLYQHLECYIKALQKEIAFAQASGGALWCFGWKELSSLNLGSGFGLMGQGAVVYLCGLLLSFAFAFYLIDTLVQLGIFGALLAFLIACWPFKITSKYTNSGTNILLNAFFVFIFMGIVVSICVVLIAESLTTEGGLGALKGALNGDDIDKVKTVLDWSFGGFLILLCCTIFGFKFCGQASSLAGQMAGGGGADIGRNIGGMIASPVVKGAKKIGEKAIEPFAKAGQRAASKAYDGAKFAIAHPMQATRAAAQGAKSFGKNVKQKATNMMNASQSRALGQENWSNSGQAPQQQTPTNGGNEAPAETQAQTFNGAPGTSTAGAPDTSTATGMANQLAQGQASNLNGLINVLNQKLEEARQLQEKSLENYEKAKEEATKAFAQYNQVSAMTAQAQEKMMTAQQAYNAAKDTPQEAVALEALNEAKAQFEQLKEQKISAENEATAARQSMNSSASDYYVNKSKVDAYSSGDGNNFNEAQARAEVTANKLGQITAEIEAVLNAQPRTNNTDTK